MLFSFVILHYNTIDDTIECINSILKNIDYNSYHIVVVDNGSKNQTGIRLIELYEKNPKVTIIINSENLGFAKGNNIGFHYSKYTLKADFIALINNDTVISQSNFIIKILEKYETTKFHILGPDIISTIDNSHQNPRYENLDSLSTIKKHVKHFRKVLILNYLFLDEILVKLKKKVIPKSKLPDNSMNQKNQFTEELIGVKLHGSALVFSPVYIIKYEGLYSETFMYSEESILYYIVRRDKLITLYTPEVKIFHKEDSATDSIYKKKIYKRRFYYKNYIKSAQVLISLIECDNGKNKM